MEVQPKKELGQHWLDDEADLAAIVATAELSPEDTVLEIGPGLGALTKHLVATTARLVAVEADAALFKRLTKQSEFADVEFRQADIRRFDLSELPEGYKVVANIPYYLTSWLLQHLLEAENPPSSMTLLVQKEVAERVCAAPGQMSVLAFSVQYYARPEISRIVPKEHFTPPPKIDSAVLHIARTPEPAFTADDKQLFRLVKAGFGEKRKQLKNALAGGLQLEAETALMLLNEADLSPTARAQELDMQQWNRLYDAALQRGILTTK